MTIEEVDYSNLSAEETAKRLDTSISDGITGDPADLKHRKEVFGINKLTPPPKDPFYKKIIDNLKEFIMLMLIAACIISIALKEYRDGTAVLTTIVISTAVAVGMEERGDRAIEALKALASNIKVKIFRNKKLEQIDSEEVCVGDLIDLNPGDKIPADGRLVESDGLKIDESILTGESVPVSKHSDTLIGKIALADRKNCAYSGTYISEGRGKLITTGVGDHTEIGKIASDLNEADITDTPIKQKLGVLGKQLSMACTVLVAILFTYTLIQMGTYTLVGVKDAFEVSIALIVAAVPEGLPTMVALTLAFNALKMKDKNALVRNMRACVDIGNVDVICSDKTGTLTQNKMTVVKMFVDGRNEDPKDLTNQYMINNMAVNSTADVIEKDGELRDLGSSSECAMLRCIGYLGHNYKSLRSIAKVVKVLDFSSDRKMMSTIVQTGGTFPFTIYSKGAPEKILDRCNLIYINGKVETLLPAVRDQIEKDIEGLQGQAMRVLAFAQAIRGDPKELESEDDLIFVGYVGIEDPVRHDVKDAIATCHRAGIDVKMLTGDHLITAKAIARQLGMLKTNSIIYEARDIEQMSDEELMRVLPDLAGIARCTPSLKQRIATLLKQMGWVVAMTGDGVNDAPALKAADVGIAMGITGTEVAKQASDIVLLDDNFSTIVGAIKQARMTYGNFQRFLMFQLTVNFVAFFTAFMAKILGFELPFTTIQLLWVNLIMDGLPALSLGLEPVRDELMNMPPISRVAKIITSDMILTIFLHGLYIGGSILLLMKTHFLGGTAVEQSTIIFSTFVLFVIWNGFNCREFENDSILPHFLDNKAALLMIGGAGIGQIILVQVAGSWFNTVPLSPGMWGIIISYTFSVIIFSEATKLLTKLTISVLDTKKHTQEA
jgi:Ca2+-transporting ATPase